MKDNNHPMEDLKKIHDEVWKAAYEIIEWQYAVIVGGDEADDFFSSLGGYTGFP